MERKYEVGAHVMYIDAYGRPHPALVTVWWSGAQDVPSYRAENGEPGCNLVCVESDEAKTDSYGRQILRYTSVVHKSKQAAHGWMWCWPDEV